MTHSTDRILTTHVGSLVRPPELVSLLRAREDGEAVDGQTFDECLRRSVTEVVQQQADVGIDIVSDGEFGKSVSWSRYILERLDGFEDRPDPTRKGGSPFRTAVIA
jgi:5-methyltetrahydropteroyltriglutamate--homocysteine methyltransferase